MKLLLFTQATCPKCPEAKRVVEGIDIKKEFWDINEPFGLGEAAWWDVITTPSIVLTKDNKEVKGWRSIVPSKEDILAAIGSIENVKRSIVY